MYSTAPAPAPAGGDGRQDKEGRGKAAGKKRTHGDVCAVNTASKTGTAERVPTS